MKFSAFILASLLAAPSVLAHGHVRRGSIQDVSFEGNGAGGPATIQSPIRQVSSQDPIKGANNPAITCGLNSAPAALVANANPGDTVKFDWRAANDGKWPHNIGPMLTYMASCGSVSCDKFDQANAQWFKIDQVGKDPTNKGLWVQNQVKDGALAAVQIPKNIAPGNYLIRHEIIALHIATSVGGAEFYAGCVQLNVGGNGNGVPKASDLVRLPGAYSDNDPGIFTPNVFDTNAPYVFPGPPVATFVEGSTSPSPSSSSSGSPLPLSPTPLPTGTPSEPSPLPSTSKPCHMRKKPLASSVVPSPVISLVAAGDRGSSATPSPTPTPTPASGTGYSDYRPRRLGHIMRRMAFENSFF